MYDLVLFVLGVALVDRPVSTHQAQPGDPGREVPERATRSVGAGGEVFVLDATASTDPDGFIVEYAWFFDDGTVHVDSEGGSTDGVFDGMTTFAFGEPETVHLVVLTVMDDDGAMDEDEVVVRVLGPLGGVLSILDLVLGYELSRGPETAVLAKLNAAAAALSDGDDATARAALEDLLDQLSAQGFCAHQTPPGFCDAVGAEVERLLDFIDG